MIQLPYEISLTFRPLRPRYRCSMREAYARCRPGMTSACAADLGTMGAPPALIFGLRQPEPADLDRAHHRVRDGAAPLLVREPLGELLAQPVPQVPVSSTTPTSSDQPGVRRAAGRGPGRTPARARRPRRGMKNSPAERRLSTYVADVRLDRAGVAGREVASRRRTRARPACAERSALPRWRAALRAALGSAGDLQGCLRAASACLRVGVGSPLALLCIGTVDAPRHRCRYWG